MIVEELLLRRVAEYGGEQEDGGEQHQSGVAALESERSWEKQLTNFEESWE